MTHLKLGEPSLNVSDYDHRREIPSFIEPRPPANYNPWRQLRPVHLQFDEESVLEEESNDRYKVYLRLKPSKDVSEHYEIKSNVCLITNGLEYVKREKTKISKMFEFSHIFGSTASQAEVFDEIVKENLENLLNQNFTLLTYGASGSGKTFTLIGSVEKPGLIPRSLEYLFKIIGPMQQPDYMPKDGNIIKLNEDLHSQELQVSFVEIYNENIYDLLEPSGRKQNKLKIYEDPKFGAFVKGLKQIFVKSGAEAYDVMLYGQNNLTYASTGIHSNSSRSHSIFTISLVTVMPDGSTHLSHMRLCDLAGAERAAKTENTGDRMQESKYINNSLHVLELCLRSLRSKQEKSHDFLVPFRQSKLTRILSRGLSGASNEKVGIVINVNPHPDYIMETRHVLEMASVATSIRVNTTEDSTTCTTTDVADDTYEVIKLRSERDRLLFELEMTRVTVERLKVENEQQREMWYNKMMEVMQEAGDLARQRQCKQSDMEIAKLQKENNLLVEKYRKLKRKVTSLQNGSEGSDDDSRLIEISSSDDSESDDESESDDSSARNSREAHDERSDDL